ncbi:hypothetical protein AJ80_01275 [Polytolypa hystricis UAMH7299]|uniref:Zn(2)-C6 fungal-type domain-containing protein n=1 Tax=Polytolypa hystricis (strain UAMH7299) TaxID=1447883 RepID=A0A2B7Z1T6_POLH7|nr:hypothetical protein AJ80_01275 [Polytolypa hystricis UAMH7299]
MELDGTSGREPPPGQSLPNLRAQMPVKCDYCRHRKIKCDRNSPCSNCRTANTRCHISPKVKDQRQRVLISHQYEKKIELIEERLSGIESILRGLAISISNAPPAASANLAIDSQLSRQDGRQRLSTARTSVEPSQLTPGFEAEPSFEAHSAHASELFAKAMGNSPGVYTNPEMAEALSSLRDIVKRQRPPTSVHTLRFPGQLERERIDVTKLELPPIDAISMLLKLCKESHPFFFLSIAFVSLEEFIQLCKDLYFCVDECCIAHFACVNGSLSYLFDEYKHYHSGNPATAMFNDYAALCRRNFELAIGDFDIFVQPSLQNVSALALAAFHATELSKPSLCWNFVSAAARMCQTLGYHRSVPASETEASANSIRKVFWFLYILDKDLTLCLGRTSAFQDYDIAVELPKPSPNPKHRPWSYLYTSWISYSRIVGQIYERLYSVRAQSESGDVRARHVTELASEVEHWSLQKIEVDFNDVPHAKFFEWNVPATKMSRYFLLTLIYRVLPSSQSPAGLDPRCIDVARNALLIHQHFVREFQDKDMFAWKGYINWTLLQCPFTPFIVLFSHTISSPDLDDLKLLEEVSLSLQAAARVSDGVERLSHICSVFYKVAKVYVKATNNSTSSNHSPIPPYPGTEFDTYLQALGLGMPSVSTTNTAAPAGGAGFPSRTPGTSGSSEAPVGDLHPLNPFEGAGSPALHDMYLGNPYMMGLLDSDSFFTQDNPR